MEKHVSMFENKEAKRNWTMRVLKKLNICDGMHWKRQDLTTRSLYARHSLFLQLLSPYLYSSPSPLFELTDVSTRKAIIRCSTNSTVATDSCAFLSKHSSRIRKTWDPHPWYIYIYPWYIYIYIYISRQLECRRNFMQNSSKINQRVVNIQHRFPSKLKSIVSIGTSHLSFFVQFVR